MDIRTSGHQVDVGDALKTHVQDRLQGIADKYFSRAISAELRPSASALPAVHRMARVATHRLAWRGTTRTRATQQVAAGAGVELGGCAA